MNKQQCLWVSTAECRNSQWLPTGLALQLAWWQWTPRCSELRSSSSQAPRSHFQPQQSPGTLLLNHKPRGKGGHCTEWSETTETGQRWNASLGKDHKVHKWALWAAVSGRMFLQPPSLLPPSLLPLPVYLQSSPWVANRRSSAQFRATDFSQLQAITPVWREALIQLTGYLKGLSSASKQSFLFPTAKCWK